MNEDLDETEFLARAVALANDRGYRAKGQTEMAALADEMCSRMIAARRLYAKIGVALNSALDDVMWEALDEHGDAARAKWDNVSLEYFAALDALEIGPRKAHIRRMVDRYGTGFLGA